MDKVKKFFEETPLEKENENVIFYFIDIGLASIATLSYSFNSGERDDIQKKLRQEAKDRLICTTKYPKDYKGLSWLDYKRSSIGNMFNTRSEAEEKLDSIMKVLSTPLSSSEGLTEK